MIVKKYKVRIGIDTGVKTGIVVWYCPGKCIRHLATTKIHNAMDTVKYFYENFKRELFVRVEDARKRKIIPYQKDIKAELGRREGAGSVKRDAIIWEDFLTDLGVDFELVAPKDNKTKVTDKYFKQLTGYVGITSEHSRDAGMLVIGY